MSLRDGSQASAPGVTAVSVAGHERAQMYEFPRRVEDKHAPSREIVGGAGDCGAAAQPARPWAQKSHTSSAVIGWAAGSSDSALDCATNMTVCMVIAAIRLAL